MKSLRRDERQSSLGQSPGRLVHCVDFVEEVQRQMIPVAGGDDLLFVTEVIQDVRGMGAVLIFVRVTSFMFGGDVGNMIGNFNQLCPAVLCLATYALIALGIVLLKPTPYFQTKFL